MEKTEVFEKFVKIITPYAKNKENLDSVSEATTILKDLGVNSSRLVDVIIAMEDEFDIEVADEDAAKVVSVGDAVSMILAKKG